MLQLPIPSIKPVAWFHAYVLCTIIGIRWGKHAPTYANSNKQLEKILREYLEFTCGDDEWTKGRILEAMRCKTGASMKADARRAFPSLFPRNRKAHPLSIPIELGEREVKFDLNRIAQWKRRVKAIKKELTMNENAVAQEVVTENEVITTDDSEPQVSVNFFIPKGVNPSTLTLENYREVTGKRFRMTKDQKGRGLDRAVAFAESKALAVSLLGGN